jgi:hypothetical protein
MKNIGVIIDAKMVKIDTKMHRIIYFSHTFPKDIAEPFLTGKMSFLGDALPFAYWNREEQFFHTRY